MSQSALSETEEHSLDRPIWSALTGAHRELALGGDLARRYPPEIGPLAALSESTPAAFHALSGLIPQSEQVALFTPDPISPPPSLHIAQSGVLYQMIATDCRDVSTVDLQPLRLNVRDVPEMIELVEMTRPGPFGPRTHELGTYLGIREGGRLAAMAGERMRFGRFVEVSAVCVHPESRGKGYAQFLITALMRKIMDRAAIPILHVFVTNSAAIALYERLGFAIHKQLRVSVLQHAAAESVTSRIH